MSSLLQYAPAQVLFLIAHEFQHKILFQGHSPRDNEAIGPFPYGRDLIDSAAQAIVEIAKFKGYLGQTFSLHDEFKCEVLKNNQPLSRNIVSTPRNFFTQDFRSYVTGINLPPRAPAFCSPESFSSCLFLRLESKETYGCEKKESTTEERYTHVSLLRWTEASSGPKEESLSDYLIPNYNILCDESHPWMEVRLQDLLFRCQYLGPHQ